MSYQLFLDDERLPHRVTWANLPPGPWTVVRNYSEFVSYIKKHGMPVFVSFDHDLADEYYRPSMYNPDKHYTKYYTDETFKEKTGYDCAKWLINYCLDYKLPFPKYEVHSMNPIGKENIKSIIENYKNLSFG
jgi:hypothetical protein